MTEQEKRIVVIRRISEVLSASWCRKGKCTENECAIDECDLLTTAKVLHDAGYRKEEEVQRETAKMFLKMLYDMGVDKQTVETCGIYDVNGSELARLVSQEFGVEVEE